MTYYHLSHRTLLSLSGDNPVGFLQDILTADIASLTNGQMRQSCLLSPQGRILCEMLILIADVRDKQSVFIACDHGQADELRKKLTLYRLRRDITITQNDDLMLIASKDAIATALVSCQDDRAPDRGYLSVVTTQEGAHFAYDDLNAYHAQRIQDAIPEGPIDLIPNRALMLEAGLDLLGAVDFQKGCYIGQEVTARTRYRGLVKRRLVPLIGQGLTSGQPVIQDNKEIGTLLSVAPYEGQSIGLASLRLSAIHEAEAGNSLVSQGHALRVQIPDHIRPIPEVAGKD